MHAAKVVRGFPRKAACARAFNFYAGHLKSVRVKTLPRFRQSFNAAARSCPRQARRRPERGFESE